MGCAAGKHKVQHLSEPVLSQKMLPPETVEQVLEELEVHKQEQVHFKRPTTKLEKEGTIDYTTNPDYMGLRKVLDEPVGCQYLGKFMVKNKTNTQFDLLCWVDIHEYKAIPTKDYRRLV